ncbi:sulfite exporter TauE/SafE family protein [Adhaeribacter soli]|uniref:Probable membrane transporter protein n=1 Tax=Adhaeribacter soli TaxID=2607655 RepID=A0A5N1J7S9_9BACT|nr:sulfite exporter TauE/SafE family protein [Adhaeribacter soli]KAA9340860.1 sulfite exporter TauE/SafE family protein [Adhaeribacter soli]
MLDQVLIFVIGIIVSAFGTLVGFGGGIFMVPILIIFFQYSIENAIGATLASLLPASLISSFFNYREKNIDYLVATLIQVPAIAGTITGAFLVAFMPVLEMQFFFAFFVIALSIYLLSTRKSPAQSPKKSTMYRLRRMPTTFIRRNRHKKVAYRLNGGIIGLFGYLSGCIAGLFGVGGGFLQTPFMIRVFRMPPQIATSTSLFILIITSFSGLVSHYLLGHVIWLKTMPLMAAFAIGAAYGKVLRHRRTKLPGTEIMIGVGLFLAGIGLILNILIRSNYFQQLVK